MTIPALSFKPRLIAGVVLGQRDRLGMFAVGFLDLQLLAALLLLHLGRSLDACDSQSVSVLL